MAHPARDPIMEDDHFSLKFGNPIQLIHNIPKHTYETFEPTKDHLPSTLATVLSTGDAAPTKDRPSSARSQSYRDSTSVAEFVHKDGSVAELKHEQP
ncbi:uncharacterized protein BYT42DRAFT_258736 [Radiomyces spectabilis]|uniref:uncharacterized protein n=1 Tax=Radiomyces spectabilis TaxID=64574 RepID=UPI0022209DC7|nr:uncharacterized protein BYT42DRAFT_258736 [Radiomyces spectabilis]KAI8384376.1 hypothetical protein BYT42DRAFT_258736 [Radiomyces spectabilis]